jgi:hypothetical protein
VRHSALLYCARPVAKAHSRSGAPARPAGGSAPPGSVGAGQSAASAALARGDARTARKLAARQASSTSEAERAEGRRILDQTAPDRLALLAAGAVLLAFALAAWFFLIRA